MVSPMLRFAVLASLATLVSAETDENGNIHWLSIVHMVLLAIVQPLFFLLVYKFYKINQIAWFKILLFFWYFVTPFVGIVQIILTHLVPESNPYSTRFYNYAALLVTTCGMIDNIQLSQVLQAVSKEGIEASNWKFAKILVLLYGASTVISVIPLALDLPMNVTRVFTALGFFTEGGLCLRTLMIIDKTFKAKAAITGSKKRGGNQSIYQYYLATTCQRAFQACGILTRVLDWSKLVITTMHFFGTTSLVIVVWSLRKKLGIKFPGDKEGSEKSTNKKSKDSKKQEGSSSDSSASSSSSAASTSSGASSSGGTKIAVKPTA